MAEEQITVREWRLRKARWEREPGENRAHELNRKCRICGLDGLRHDFECPMRDPSSAC